MMSKKYLRVIAGASFAAVLLAACGGAGSGSAVPSIPGNSAPSRQPGLHGYQVLYRFKGGADGEYPFGNVVVDAGGTLYGATNQGGAYGSASGGYGTVFSLSPSGKTIIHSFAGGADGAYPQSGLTLGSGGAIYGTTDYGGGGAACSGGCGTVYALTPSGSGYGEQVVYAFQGGSDGEAPVGNVISDSSGAIYGTTVEGGGSSACATSAFTGCGTVFKLTPAGSGYTESVIYAFQAGSDGTGPRGGLIMDSSGALYGTTYSGGGVAACTGPSGNPGCGTVFKLTPTASGYTESIIHTFQGPPYDGAFPRAGLLLGKSGVLYGVTHNGGVHNNGTVYQLTPSGSTYNETIILSVDNYFKQGARSSLENGLYADGSGNLYGTTQIGGKQHCHCGTIFKLSPHGSTWTETLLHSFGGSRQHDGQQPRAGLVADKSGTLYGTTPYSGVGKAGEWGTVYKIAP
jgi:uncharacterized repeat protein (TIGR03803 family)